MPRHNLENGFVLRGFVLRGFNKALHGQEDFCMNDFLRLPKVADVMCMSRSTLYLRIKQGLLTPPVKLSTRCSIWPEQEIAAIRTAHVAQKTEDEIRQLVILLKQQRRALMV